MVKVADPAGAIATGELTSSVASQNERFLGGGGSSVGMAVVQQPSVAVGDRVTPQRVGLLIQRDLSGDVGQDRSPAGDQRRVVRQPHQGRQVDLYVDHPSARGNA